MKFAGSGCLKYNPHASYSCFAFPLIHTHISFYVAYYVVDISCYTPFHSSYISFQHVKIALNQLNFPSIIIIRFHKIRDWTNLPLNMIHYEHMM